jgi:hypothetical protein
MVGIFYFLFLSWGASETAAARNFGSSSCVGAFGQFAALTLAAIVAFGASTHSER